MTRLLCAMFALFTFGSALAADEVKRMTGLLLVARAGLTDPDFRDSVVFVTNQSGPAPVGVIINKPTRITVASLFPDIGTLAELDDKVHFGGPSAPDMLSFHFRADRPPAHRGVMEVIPGVYFSTNYRLLVELLNRDKPIAGLRIYRGHARWEPGQLEGEVARKDWMLVPANPHAMFETRPERLWPDLQGGASGPQGVPTGPRAAFGTHTLPAMWQPGSTLERLHSSAR